jgi:hypothetical protein
MRTLGMYITPLSLGSRPQDFTAPPLMSPELVGCLFTESLLQTC